MALSFLVDNFRELVACENLRLLSSAELTELKQLQDDLRGLMQAVLEDSRTKYGDGKLLARDIRECAYDAQDMIDACSMSRRRFWNRKHLKLIKTLRAFKNQKLSPLLVNARMFVNGMPALSITYPSTEKRGIILKRIGHAETLMKHCLHEKPEQLDVVSIDGLPALSITSPPTQQRGKQKRMVCFEDEAETLMKHLLHEKTEQLDVISIVGIPGLGKTRLAWEIYTDYTIEYEFPYLIWVSVDEEFNARDVFLTILRNMSEEDMSQLPDALLADIVRNNLENQRFLIIIDGVHTTREWRVIESALPKTNRSGGKVLLTTRNRGVAREASRNREPHMLRFLNPGESWELLQLQVFGRTDKCPPELEGVGRHIANKCGGLPLGVVVVGGYLVNNCSRGKEFWEEVSKKVTAYLQDDRLSHMEYIISLSYNRLPLHLRDCFLYLGMFPRDTEIPAWKLTCLWIAEGFVQPDRVKSLEEVAGEYLNDLVDMSLVMVDKTKANGDVKTCRVNDMIRQFCRNEASSANKNLFREVEMILDPATSEIEQCRRLCVHSNVIEFLEQNPKGPKVRSFVCFSEKRIILQAEHTLLISDGFDLLRVLDVDTIHFRKLSLKLFRLIHLRYISLSGDEFRVIPVVASKLWNLQTIKIHTTTREIAFKADIWNMMQLRHVKTKAALVLAKQAKGEGGENLQTLSRLSTQSLTDDLCDRAFNLKNLGIRGDLNTLIHTTCLARLYRLEKLKLLHDVFPLEPSPLRSLPDQRAFPPNLRILELSFTWLEWKHMRTLGMLSALEMLKLIANAFVGSSWKVDGGCFPYLEALQIEHLDLEVWTASEDSFPRLRCLVLKNCEKLQGIPHVLVKTLQVVDVESVTKSLVDSAMRIKEEVQAQPGATGGGFQLTIS